MKIVIVIPTYNEAENVKKLVPLLSEELKNISHDVKTLFVDDSSPDNTASILKEMKKSFPFINVLVRKEKTGLGDAYIDGFKKAMKEMEADVVMEMDADLQHDPKEIKNFVKAIEDGSDYVLGSRYISGGSIPTEWALYRKLLSWGGSVFARLALGLYKVRDITTGFKATRVRGIMDKIDFDEVISSGFAYKIDLLYRTHKVGAKIKEIPIKFGLRDRGDSKMEQNNMVDSLKVVLALRIKESISFIKFVVVGFIGLGTDTLIFNVLRVTLFPSTYSSAVSGFIAMIVTFLLNNAWSFSYNKITSFKDKLGMFVPYAISSYIPIIFRSWLIGFALEKIANNGWVANGAFLVGVIIGLVWNFTVYSKIIWRKKSYD